MLTLLVIAATPFEIAPLQNWYHKHTHQQDPTIHFTIDFRITGIGMLETGITLQESLTKKSYDMVFQLGIAGAYNHNYKIGQVVQVTQEIYGDLGAENNDAYLTAAALNWESYLQLTFHNPNYLQAIPKVSSITVQTCAGTTSTIATRTKLFSADIENMEGLAFFRIMADKNIPYYQIRSISNYVIPRDTSQWNIPLSIHNLNDFVQNWLQTYLNK